MKKQALFLAIPNFVTATFLAASFAAVPALAMDKLPKASAAQEAQAPNDLEAKIISEVLTQFFNSLRRVSVDFQLNSLVLDSQKETTRDVVVTAQAYFDKNISVNLFETSSNLLRNTEAIIPRVTVDAKDLYAKGSYREYPTNNGPVIEGRLDFANFKTGKTRFVNIRAENDIIPNIFSITLRSAKLNIKDGQIKGSCDSEKVITDIHTGQTKSVKMICEVSGTLKDSEYSLKVRYVDAVKNEK